MISRYSREELKNIWSEKYKFECWLEVELLALEAYSKVNKNIKGINITKLKEKIVIDPIRIKELEKDIRHDVVAFTRQISENLDENEKKWIHYGLTSTDVVDTAQSYRLKQVNKILKKQIDKFILTLKNMAIKNKNVYMIGRTHGIHAEVTTFGYKIALWYDEMQRNLERFIKTSNQIQIAKISGSVGNYANIPLEIQEHIAKKLELNSSKVSNQVIQRDRHAEYITTLALIATTLEKIALEIRHLQRTEIGEVEENFGDKQKGSSSMPHKKNPIISENICGLSRVMRSYISIAFENIPLWHERDISHSSTERIMLSDSTTLLDYMLEKMNTLLNNLKINETKMKDNIFLTHGTIFSQRCIHMLIDRDNISRNDAYDQIQKLAIHSYDNQTHFRQELSSKGIFSNEELDKIFDLKYYSKNINALFKRIGL